MQRILFTGGGGAGNEAIARLLASRHDCYFADANPGAIDSAIPAARRIAIPMARDPGFVEAVAKAMRDHRIDVLVPGVDEELLALANAAPSLAPARVFLPSAEFVATMLDKSAAMMAMAAAGLSVPATRPALRAEELPFPIILKPRSGRGSRGVEKIKRQDQVQAYLKLNDVLPGDIIAQELAVGPEYTVFVCGAENGDLAAVVPVLVGLKKGITIAAQTSDDTAIYDYILRFHAAFRPVGPYNVQLIKRGAEILPFEVNPRVSTTFCMILKAGFDPFAPLPPGEVFRATRKVSLKRQWQNVLTLA